MQTEARLWQLDFVLWICFEFRVSDFEFVLAGHEQRPG